MMPLENQKKEIRTRERERERERERRVYIPCARTTTSGEIVKNHLHT